LRQLSGLGLGDGLENTVDLLLHVCDLLCDSDSFHFTVNDTSIEITDVPDSPRLEDVSLLLPFSFQVNSPFLTAYVFAHGLWPQALRFDWAQRQTVLRFVPLPLSWQWLSVPPWSANWPERPHPTCPGLLRLGFSLLPCSIISLSGKVVKKEIL